MIKRTATHASGGITADEKKKMEAHSELWIRRALRTEPIDEKKIIRSIKDLYKATGLKEPRVVVVPSPLVMAIAGSFASKILLSRKDVNATIAAAHDATDAATIAAAIAATRDATFSATGAATDAATRAATIAAARDATFSATHDATDAATRAATRAATDAATFSATVNKGWIYDLAVTTFNNKKSALDAISYINKWSSFYHGGNMWPSVDCYLTAARDILGLDLPQHKKYAAWEQCAIHGGFRYMHAEFCIVCDFPEVLLIDEQNRPHCSTGPSHKWRDGWSLYHWHGVVVPAEWIENKSTLTPEIALTCANLEQRRAACEILGWDSILKSLKAKTIDSDDEEIGDLLEVDLPDSGINRFLRVKCGTGRTFTLAVPPNIKTALEASAWTYGLENETQKYIPEIRT